MTWNKVVDDATGIETVSQSGQNHLGGLKLRYMVLRGPKNSAVNLPTSS